MFLISMSSISAEICQYNGMGTVVNSPYIAPGAKAEYAGEQFVQLANAKAITNLDQLKGLTCLEFADFYNQGINGDLVALKDLLNLKVLSLHTNPEVQGDFCVLRNAVQLKSLKLPFNEKVYGDIACLENINLETFAMTYTKISGDLSDLSHMTNLKALYLSGTNVKGDISALSELTNLEELTLSDADKDGSQFVGDLAALNNLKKLRRVAIYNTKTINCDKFTEAHPNIEGGCSDESQSTVINTNVKSEQMIGKGERDVLPPECVVNGQFIGDDQCRIVAGMSAPGGRDAPPKECIVDGSFIGEDKCRALVKKSAGPPGECIIDGTFIGEDKCRSLMEVPQNSRDGTKSEKIEAQPPETSKNFVQIVIGWLRALFK